MKKALLLLLLAGILGSVPVSAAPGPPVHAQVVIFDVRPAETSQFEAKVLETGRLQEGQRSFVGERFLRNIDAVNPTYALYTKSTSLRDLEAGWATRSPQLRPYLRRDPEVHSASLTHTYTPASITTRPSGDEFGTGQTGQIAHLGLFIPFQTHRAEYERILRLVKEDTQRRNPAGFIGEDLLEEVRPASLAAQTPHSPRAAELVPMSINYGEFATIEEAENAYIQRGADRTGDPRLRYWYRAFFGSLQVPSRFYIFRVIGNLPESSRVVENAEPAVVADARSGN